ncbi:hypothetical protein QQ008_17230 [Fulvivirgaceae bacterium BMA10]|uniref:Glucosamine inositolphosphorylceramide transferase 1 N-terminal domain-containing protein n=1 Tax=Splendidivirga corallicola TaxID=3051826 RepID=A0ABT8KQV6_9BACT|nr:hypothetical protein [Fulvivirgaceae bacterium BMA10]
MTNKSKVSVGLLMDSFAVPAWVFLMLEKIRDSDHSSISLIVLNEQKHTKSTNLSDSFLMKIYRKLERLKVGKIPNHLSIKNAENLLGQIPSLKINAAGNKKQTSLSAEDIQKIKAYNIDVFIQVGFSSIGREFPTTKFGIWALQHGVATANGFNFPGFWEVLKGHPFFTSRLVNLRSENDQSEILYTSNSLVNIFSIYQTASIACWKSASFIPRKLKGIAEGKINDVKDVKTEFDNRIYKEPNQIDLVRLIIDFSFKFIKEKIVNRFIRQQWTLLYKINNQSGAPENYKIITPPKNRFWADPFILERNNQYYVFIEESKMGSEKKGYLSYLTFDKQGNHSKPQKIIEQPYHMSYPFLLEWQNELYMIPESNKDKNIQLYKCKQFPNEWEFQYNLMEDLEAVDTTLFFHNNLWWMFTNIKENEGGSLWDELFLFYADNPLSKNWIPHPQNPIVSDVTRSRPAGEIFNRDGKIIRPAQNCSFRYGYGLKFLEITKLSTSEYEEREISSIEPDWNPSINAVHTFNRAGDFSIMDAVLKRNKFFGRK